MKTPNLFIVLTLVAGVYSASAQPSLNISPAGNQSVLFWPTWAANYTLQSTTNLTSPSWLPVDDAVPVIAFTVTNTSPASFFRLFANNGSISNGMAFISAGAFIMGDTQDGEADADPVIVSTSAYYMDVNLVSLSQWQSVYNWATNNGYGFDNAGSGKAANHPVQTVNWYDCVKWCNARSQQAGLAPVYYTDTGLTQVYTNGDTNEVYANWATNGFRLPTEAEWEKAARGGLSGLRFPWGNTISENQANYRSGGGFYTWDLSETGYNPAFNYGVEPYTNPVGSFASNGYFLYDMAGNVFEWCWDWFITPYAGGIDPHGPDGVTSSAARALRGGCWVDNPYNARCATRIGAYTPNSAVNYIGFRCARRF